MCAYALYVGSREFLLRLRIRAELIWLSSVRILKIFMQVLNMLRVALKHKKYLTLLLKNSLKTSQKYVSVLPKKMRRGIKQQEWIGHRMYWLAWVLSLSAVREVHA